MVPSFSHGPTEKREREHIKRKCLKIVLLQNSSPESRKRLRIGDKRAAKTELLFQSFTQCICKS